MDKDSGYLLSDVEFLGAIIAKIQSTGTVVSLENILRSAQLLFFLYLFEMVFSPLFESLKFVRLAS